MLEKSKRLNLKKDFKRIAAGKRVETKFVKLFIKFEGAEIPKLGIATSKAYFKKATERNRARRLVSYAFENVYSRLPVGINIIALPKTGILEVKSNQVEKEIEEVLKKEKMILL